MAEVNASLNQVMSPSLLQNERLLERRQETQEFAGDSRLTTSNPFSCTMIRLAINDAHAWVSPVTACLRVALMVLQIRAHKCSEATHACLLVGQVSVSREHLSLELLLILIPQLSGLAVQWTRAVSLR